RADGFFFVIAQRPIACASGARERSADAEIALSIPPSERRHRDLGELDAVEAADVQRYHLGAVGPLAAGEHVDPAVDAELMPDGVLVEEIFLEVFLAGTELKVLRRQEREMQP